MAHFAALWLPTDKGKRAISRGRGWYLFIGMAHFAALWLPTDEGQACYFAGQGLVPVYRNGSLRCALFPINRHQPLTRWH